MINVAIIESGEGIIEEHYDMVLEGNGKELYTVVYTAHTEFSEWENGKVNKYTLAEIMHELGGLNRAYQR